MKKDLIFFDAINRQLDARLNLAAIGRNQVPDIKNYAADAEKRQVNGLINARGSEIESTQVLGMPAWRFEVTGISRYNSSSKLTFLDTMIDTGAEVLLVTTYTGTEKFPRLRDTLIKLMDGLKGVGSASPAPTPDTSPGATAVQGSTVPPAGDKAPEQTSSIAERLTTLNKLFKDGLITEKEFEAKKQEILRGL